MKRRTFLKAVGLTPPALAAAARAQDKPRGVPPPIDPSFLVRREELELNFRPADGARRLSFSQHRKEPARWRDECRRKLAELTGISTPGPAEVKELRRRAFSGVAFTALVMRAGEGLSMPAYLLEPEGKTPAGAVMAIHGHGDVEAVIGVRDDYHHRFGLELARAGFTVLCPALEASGPCGTWPGPAAARVAWTTGTGAAARSSPW
jgi:hypothetical protein